MRALFGTCFILNLRHLPTHRASNLVHFISFPLTSTYFLRLSFWGLGWFLSLGGKKVEVRLSEKEFSNSHGARPVHQIITMMKLTRTSRLSIKNALSHWEGLGFRDLGFRVFDLKTCGRTAFPVPDPGLGFRVEGFGCKV